MVYKDGVAHLGYPGLIESDNGNGMHINTARKNRCMKIDYCGGGWVGLCWQNPQGEWDERVGGVNLSSADKLEFWARGERGGEHVGFGVGGLCGKMISDTLSKEIKDIELTSDWKRYEIDLRDYDLSLVKTTFKFWMDRQQTFYLKNIYFYKSQSEKDECEKLECCSLAFLLWMAEHGDKNTMYELGRRNEIGVDYARDMEAAQRWYQNAGNHGCNLAKSKLRDLAGIVSKTA